MTQDRCLKMFVNATIHFAVHRAVGFLVTLRLSSISRCVFQSVKSPEPVKKIETVVRSLIIYGKLDLCASTSSARTEHLKFNSRSVRREALEG